MHLDPRFLLLPLLAVSLAAQEVGIDNLDPAAGSVNGFPFNSTTNGNTSLHVYTAQALRDRGLCAGAVLLDIAVAPTGTSAGVYTAPQALLRIGHLTVSPPIPGAWTTHLDQPITIHDLTSGPYTFPWAAETWTSLPGTQTTGFVWDGVRDFGMLYSSSPGVTGSFSARRTDNQPRHYTTTFNATTQAPTSTAAFAIKARLTWAGPAGCATRFVYGTGCYDEAASFYERFTSLAAFDLGGAAGAESVLSFLPQPGGYVVVPGTSAWFTPASSPVLNNSGTPGVFGDNSISSPLNLPFSFPFPGGSTSVVHLAANGYVILGSTTSNSADTSPTAVELLSQQPRLAPLWCDLHPTINVPTNPNAGVYFDVDPSNQAVYLTWLDNADRRGNAPAAGATSVNVQVVLRASGEVEYRYGTLLTNASGLGFALVGWSPGNAGGGTSRDPGSADLSLSLPIITGADRTPLVLDSTFPRLGSSFTFTVRNVPNVQPAALLAIGDTQLPGIDLGFIGAPGCPAYSNGNIVTFGFPAVGGTGTLTLNVPNQANLIGTTFTSQAAALSLENALNAVTSNGLSWTLGN